MSDTPFALQPLGADVPEEAAQLAHSLREVFSGLRISVRRYATRTHRNPGAVSRYLNGTRVPPWEFVSQLLTESNKAQGRPLSAEVVEHIRAAHRNALKSSNKRLHEVQELQDQLEDADLRVQQAGMRERVLLEGLQVREQRIAELETRQLELTTRWENELHERDARNHALAVSRDSQADELEQLKFEVEQLRSDLEEAKEASAQAEERCLSLEAQLAEAEARAQSGQEAREASLLEAAQRDAAEAQATAEELRRRLEDMEQQEKRRSEAEAGALRGIANQKRDWLEKQAEPFKDLNADEIALALIRTQITDSDGAAVRALKGLSATAPIDKLRLTCIALWERDYTSLAERLAGNIGAESNLTSVLEFLTKVGERDTSKMASNLTTRALSNCAWFRSSSEVLTFLDMLAHGGHESWSLLIHDECAIRREPGDLASLINELPGKKKDEMLDTIADSRPTEAIPPLLGQMTALELTDEVAMLMRMLRTMRPDDYAVINDAWTLATQ